MIESSPHLESLLAAGEASSEQYALLRRAGCLSSAGVTWRDVVVTELERLRDEYSANWQQHPELMSLPGRPTLPQTQVRALDRGGYLNPDGCEAFEALADDGATIERLVSEVRAALVTASGDPEQAEDDGAAVAVMGQHAEQPAPLPDPAEAPPDAVTPGRIACGNCGQELPAFARFCGHCGRQLTA